MARNFVSSNPDFIDHGNPAVLDLTGDQVTLSLWLRVTVTTDGKVFGKWADVGTRFSYLLQMQSSGTALFAINTGSVTLTASTTDLVDGQWHHLAGTYDGSDIRIYVDGVEENSAAKTGNMPSNTAPVRIGMGGSGTENPYDGDLGHAALWGVALSASEVASLGVGISPRRIRLGSLLFYDPLNGQSPEADIIGGNTGTINGSPSVVEEPPIPWSIVAPG